MKKILFLLLYVSVSSQNIDVDNPFFYNEINRYKLDSIFSFTILPIDISMTKNKSTLFNSKPKKITHYDSKIILSYYPLENTLEYNSNFPYKSNNGIMLPNVGFQNVLSAGIHVKYGVLSVKFKPKFHLMENNYFEEFPENHFPIIWERRYRLWNNIDMPIRFGENSISRTSIGESNFFLSYKNYRFGISNENLWWGPSRNNSIMMSNNAQGFGHFTFQTVNPIEIFIGKIEFKYIDGRLNHSGYNPPNTEGESSGTKYFIEKELRKNYNDKTNLNAFIFTFSPKKIDGLNLGMIRWIQFYKKTNIFNMKVFSPKFVNNLEKEYNKASGYFIKFKEKSFEVYFEYYKNSPSYKNSLDQLNRMSENKNAHTLGIYKLFKNDIFLNWEWTRMEQGANNLIRKIGSWYEHDYVVNGYTHKGEIIGSKIGPGSNSHVITLKKSGPHYIAGLGLEIIEHDNDFYHYSFSDSRDFRRYWKDFNFKIYYMREFKNFKFNIISCFTRSLNHNWDLDRSVEPWYHAGYDKNNLHLTLNLHYSL